MIERRSHLGKPTCDPSPPESTSYAEKTPRMVEKSDERQRSLGHLGYLSGEIDHPVGELTTRDSPTKCRPGRAVPGMRPAAVFTLEQRKSVASK